MYSQGWVYRTYFTLYACKCMERISCNMHVNTTCTLATKNAKWKELPVSQQPIGTIGYSCAICCTHVTLGQMSHAYSILEKLYIGSCSLCKKFWLYVHFRLITNRKLPPNGLYLPYQVLKLSTLHITDCQDLGDLGHLFLLLLHTISTTVVLIKTPAKNVLYLPSFWYLHSTPDKLHTLKR